MAKITEIKPQVKNQDRVSIFLDGRYSFSLTSSQFMELGLKVGQELDKSKLERFKEESTYGKILENSYAWAMRRNHSEREIDQYLAKKSDSPEVVKKVKDKLDNTGFIDDTRFAEGWVEARRRRGYSNFVIKGELIKKGVTQEIIDLALEEHGDQKQALKILIDKKSRQTRYKDPQKLMAYLASKGFGYDDIKTALEEQD